MSATIEKSLCIGFTKTRFDIWDNVTLILKDGSRIEGEITDLEENKVILQVSDEPFHEEYKEIDVDFIVDYEV